MADAKVKKTRSPAKPRPTFLVYNITDADGNVVTDAKLNIVAVTKDASTAMSQIQGNQHTTLNIGK